MSSRGYPNCSGCGRPSGGEEYCARCEDRAERAAAEEAALEDLRGSVQIGDVLVFKARPDQGNPYRWKTDPNYVSGKERAEALELFRDGEEESGWEYWFAPACGGARQITSPLEIKWPTDRFGRAR